ncbi:hypothetical protein K2173_020213 [Erythroxylum novogranatense]|uniref:Agenet domain-containing protein n=1 Tax=Erythroxylum novogranatense TaxID=1862640 RepID=A0AAV8UAK6_9ROSI|nr:hypothetical protein K2173_020213 [Erythroxylum novogranatense]
MDYDDNDFQSQNLQLAGEGSNKFPPTLQPYALSKFDFDDTLHGSLRFDGLVETEVFLGIESNEDNRWIEDFSRGNSGIQFNSSAAESCSISRHNNVWSEATSSESVEMLLKSVGQEEIVPVQTSNKELDACDELGCIIKTMEPSLKYDNGTPSSVGDISGLQPILPPDEGIDNVCVASDVGGQYPQVGDNSRTCEDSLSGERDLNDQTSISADDCIAVTEGSLVPDDGGNEVSEKENITVTVSFNEMKEKASTSGIQAGCLLESSENTIGGSDEQKKENHPNFRNMSSDEDSVNVPDAYGEHQEEQHQLMQQFQGGDPVMDTNVFRSSSPHLDTTNLSNMEEPPSIESKQDSGLSEKLDIVDQFRVAKHEVEPRSDVIIEKHEVNELDYSSSHKIADNNAVTLLCKEESEPSKGKIDCSNSSHGDGSSNVGLQSSAAEFLGEKHEESHTSSATMPESKGICMRGITIEQSDTPACDENLPAEGKESTELPSDNSTMEAVVDQSLVIDKRVGAMCFGGVLENKLIDSKLPSDSAGIKTDNVGGSIGPAEHAIGSNTPVDQGDVEKSALPLVGCIYPGKNEDDLTMASVEASTSDSKTSMRLQTGSDPAAESERITYSGAPGPTLDESGDQSLLTFDTCKTSHGEPQAVVSNKGSQKNAEEIDVCPVLCDSTEKNGDAELVVKAVDAKESSDTEPAVGNSNVLGPVASSMGGSAHGAGQKDLQENELMTSSTVINYGLSAVPITSESGGSSNQVEQVSISSTVNGTAELPHDGIIKDGVKGIPGPTVIVSEITDVVVSKGSSASGDAKQNDVPVDERSFTFEVSPPADTPQKEEMAKWHPISSTITNRMIVDGTPSTSDLGQSNPKAPQEVSQGSQKTSAVAPHSSSKSKTERKTRRSSGKATAKGTPKRGTGKESTPVRLDRGDKPANVSLSPSGISQLVQSNEMQRYGHVDSSTLKPFVLAASTTSLPDLNSSVSASAMFQQPFTDLQQVQLRAQIFVYGALIQGIPPDEAYMISAFGGADGGRSIWENAWRSCIERLHGQKPHFATPETPLQSRTGARGPDQSIKQSAPGNKALSTPIGQVSTKGTTTANPTVPLSSPLWSFPTPSSGMPRGPVINYQRALSPLHPHQSPSIRSFAGNPSWISQAPFCGSWVSSPQTAALDASGHFSMQFPISETIQLTPSKDSSMPHASGVKHVLPVPVVQTEASTGVFAGASAPDLRKTASSSDRPSTEPKTRKRKKTSVSETPGHNILNPLSQEEAVAVSVSTVASHVSTSVAVTTPLNFVSKAPPEKIVTSVPVTTTDLGRMDQNIAGSAVSYEETLFKVKEARAQAQDAAAFAAAAVSHSQGIWNQLEKQRKTGMSPDIEIKLMSAAAAIDAAAAVAKAAAAAANVASNAALQAKLMADETVRSTSYRNDDQSYAVSLSGGVNNMGKATSTSILSADDGANNSSSILVAAREAARRRVEAASAASKQAENMDAIVKAAELAAEAVAQAGKIVAMGDTFLMDEAVASGSESYLKVAQVTSGRGSKFVDVSRENLKIDKSGEGPDTSSRCIEETNYLRPPTSIGTCEDDMRLVDVISSSGASVVKDGRTQKGRKASGLSKTIGVVPESENGSRSSQNEFEKTEEILKGNSIKKGSHVEVYKDGNGFKSAWFTANVLSLKDGMAHVSYDELRTAEGAEKLEEWVPLFGEGSTSPKIRIARRVTAMPFEGTRKRRRAAVVDDPWSVGDRVDAWIQDSWWEGIITEKSIKDETMFTVHFPAQNETSVVRAWHLRSSLIWKDGEWIEWSSLRETGHPTHVGDTPQEKRQRVRSPAVEAKGKDKVPKIVDSQESDKPNEPRLLDISADERIFNVGKITRDNNKPDTLRMTRTGLQKEGSRVVFGVPKPGKKRKFMEVSKHYVSDGSGKVNEPNYSAKFTRPMRPQPLGSRGWKNTSKVEANEKQAAIPKPKVLKSGKPQYASARTISSRKDNLLSAQVSSTVECPSADHIAKTTDSSSHAENTSEKHNLVDMQSFSGSEGDEGPVLFSSLSLPSKKISSNAKPERVSKGKLAPAGGKLGKIEEDKVFSSHTSKSAIDVVEPRRSNRRIQPTSRLLEGLQSSLMVSKIPSAPHDKSQKSRIGSRGNKHD